MNTEQKQETVLAERLRRQGLTHPIASAETYLPLFRWLQPVSPMGYSYPGSPPRLRHRTLFNDAEEADRLRANRELVKGRFLRSTVGYVHADDLELYGTAFRKPLPLLTDEQQSVLDMLRSVGALTPKQLKQETGILNKNLMPILHRLQEAFLVHEDQPDDNWEREWFDFERVWSDVNLSRRSWEDAAAEVLSRFLKVHVFATSEQIRDWSNFPLKKLSSLLEAMESEKVVLRLPAGRLGEGWMLAEDAGLESSPIPESVFMLDSGDMLVKSHAAELKRNFAGLEVLQHLFIDGAFIGAVVGHWRIGPHDVEDIVVELPSVERERRRDSVLRAVAEFYHPPNHRIVRCMGVEVD